jgi:AraC-like DNA-binding protein
MKVHLVGMSPYLLDISKAHSHNYWEIVLNLEGEGTTVVGDKRFEFYPGTIICQPPNELHSKVSETKFKDIFIRVRDFDISPKKDALAFTDNEEKSFETLLFLALRAFHKKEINYAAIVDSLYDAMYQLLVGWSNNVKAKNENVELFKNDLIDNFTNPEYQICDAIEKMPFCKDYFRRCFKKETGMTPISYLINLRVEYAKKLLSQRGENNHTISDIALISGFYDYHYFSRVFKNIVGVTPQEYKRL